MIEDELRLLRSREGRRWEDGSLRWFHDYAGSGVSFQPGGPGNSVVVVVVGLPTKDFGRE